MTEQHGKAVPAAATPADLLRIAIERDADLAQLEKLMDLQQRWEEQQAVRAYTEDMARAKTAAPTIEKSRRVRFRTKAGMQIDYQHEELADCTETIIPWLARFGFSHDWEIRQSDTSVTVSCVLTHKDGHSKIVNMHSPPVSTGTTMSSIQALASATTYLKRYTLLAATGLAARGDDNDGETAEPKPPARVRTITQTQADELTAMLLDHGRDVARFLKAYGISEMAELPANRFSAAKKRIATVAAKAQTHEPEKDAADAS